MPRLIYLAYVLAKTKHEPNTNLTNKGPRVYLYMIIYMSLGPKQLFNCIKENLAHEIESAFKHSSQ